MEWVKKVVIGMEEKNQRENENYRNLLKAKIAVPLIWSTEVNISRIAWHRFYIWCSKAWYIKGNWNSAGKMSDGQKKKRK